MEEDVKHVAAVLRQVERVAEQIGGGGVPGEYVEVAAENERRQSHRFEHSLRVLGHAILLAAFGASGWRTARARVIRWRCSAASRRKASEIESSRTSEGFAPLPCSRRW